MPHLFDYYGIYSTKFIEQFKRYEYGLKSPNIMTNNTLFIEAECTDRSESKKISSHIECSISNE